MIRATESPEELAKLWQQLAKSSTLDKVLEFWINAILSGPQTQIVNVLGNALNTVYVPLDTTTGALVSTIRRSGKEGVKFGEARQQLYAIGEAAKDGLKLAVRAYRTEMSSDFVSKLDDARRLKAIPSFTIRAGKANKKVGNFDVPFTGEVQLGGKQVRIPGRFLLAGDEFFKTIAQRQKINQIAYRTALEKGLKGQDFLDELHRLKNNPTEEMMVEARAFARHQTFQAPPGRFGRHVEAFVTENPEARFVLPFTRTPINLAKQGVRKTPFSILMKDVRNNILGKNGRAAQDRELARFAIGSSLAFGMMQWAAEGKITGNGPFNRAIRGS
jgi:hypothetical protein